LKSIKIITLCTILFAVCVSAQAQQPTKTPRIGFLGAVSASALANRIDGFRLGLRELGYEEGKNITIDIVTPMENSTAFPRLLGN
jgi:putative ABC transport system substrate-binding protein